MPIIDNPKLYKKAKKIADEKYLKSSAYKSGFIIKLYKEMGGTYTEDNKPKKLKTWYKEKWSDIGNKEYPVYRPTIRVNKQTPLLPSEIDPKNLKKQIKLKQVIKGESNLPPFIGGEMTKTKKIVASKIRNITKEDALKDLNNLIEIQPTKKDLNKRSGNAFLNYWMFPYRLDVKGNKLNKDGFNFYDFYKKPSDYLGEKGYKYFQEFIKEKSQNIDNNIFHFYTLYMVSVSLFKPLISKYIYQIYNPTCILDPTMGWGGRMLGAVVIPDIKYIGFDTNTDLKEPYKEMIKELKVSKRVKLYFKDSSKADFSKFNYDMVFTSPPYYKNKKLLEDYEGMPDYKDEQDWFEKFFYPVFSNSYKYLKKGGYFCINTNKEGYEMLKSFLGKCDKKMDIKNTVPNRNRIDGEFKNVSQEFIYIWNK